MPGKTKHFRTTGASEFKKPRYSRQTRCIVNTFMHAFLVACQMIFLDRKLLHCLYYRGPSNHVYFSVSSMFNSSLYMVNSCC